MQALFAAMPLLGDTLMILLFFFTVVHSKGICTDFHPKWMKNTALEAVTRVIDRHDVPSVQEYPRGHSGTSHGGLAAARVA